MISNDKGINNDVSMLKIYITATKCQNDCSPTAISVKRQNPTFYVCQNDDNIKMFFYGQTLTRAVENETS